MQPSTIVCRAVAFCEQCGTAIATDINAQKAHIKTRKHLVTLISFHRQDADQLSARR